MKKSLSIILILLCSVVFTSEVKAMDPHFSQYNATPLNTNPAMTGVFSGNYRVSGIYRSQWSSVLRDESVPMFRTFSAAVDFRLNSGLDDHDAFGVGLVFLSDKAGESEFGTNYAGLSFSYIKNLSQRGNNFITAGFQAGAAQRSINFDNLRWGNQFDGEGFNPGLSSGETNISDNYMFYDLSGGIFWYYVQERRTNYYAGFSMYHINQPVQSFYDASEVRLYSRLSFHTGMQFQIADQVDMLPSLMMMVQGPAFETMIGTYFKFLFETHIPDGNAFYIGPFYRMVNGTEGVINSESLVLAARVDYGQFNFGFSYDLNFSRLTAATNSRGGFEASLVYIGAFPESRAKTIYCPRF
ncbi:MAG: type IX secretion system membrane protein PorP/SprF [Chitinophagaceae bacterium]|nr:MAG: type IX secretion system membrane protein PorP/SprF [Chitinophagaceae bacterium]